LVALSNIATITPALEQAVALPLPFVASRVCAGFPSPAEDHTEQPIDLNQELVRHPLSTFFVRVIGDSMSDAGIHAGDLLIVDKAMPASDSHIIVAIVNGEFCVRRLRITGAQVELHAARHGYPPITIAEGMDFEVWGRVTFIIRKA
jgi:DNA polymerase V